MVQCNVALSQKTLMSSHPGKFIPGVHYVYVKLRNAQR